MSRVQEIMEMIANETDPDKLQVLEFDLRQAMGRKDADMKKSVKKRAYGGSSMTDKQKKFAALAPPTDKITYADKIAGATGKVRKAAGGGYGGGGGGDEVLAARRCKGGGIAIKGTDFKGTF
tara:strand:+ start:53 stop:418 length:366 start_codon:yes stop_codon:yes gene_type:complete